MYPSRVARTSLAILTDHANSGTKPPSAIAAFSDVVTSSHDSTPTSGITRKVCLESWPTGIHSLPTEIVRMIFQFVFESCVGSEDGDMDSLTLWLDEDPLSPSLFPYAPACVCVRWFQILRALPVYWTRLVITLDDIASSLDVARTALEWAGARLFKVIITRRHDTFNSETEDSERTNVDHAMELLRPHIGGIWSLSFDVERNSSIPALWRECGLAQHLKVLVLKSHLDAGHLAPPSRWIFGGNSHDCEGAQLPFLQQVTLSGHFLRSPLLVQPRFTNWFGRATSLTICGDATSSGNITSLRKFLSVIDKFPLLQELTVEDVCCDEHAPTLSLAILSPAVLRLRRITGGTTLRAILTRLRARSNMRTDIMITDCTVHGFRESDPAPNLRFSSTSLTLASMDLSATIEDLVCQWNGERLSVISCSRLSRSFLERLHGGTAPTCLAHLRIVDCDNFNASDVITLVQSRETQAAFVSLMGAAEDDSFTALKELCVQGRGPPVSAKRAAWLAEHVETFSWDTVAKDGWRYVWDGSNGKLTKLPASGSCEALLSGFGLETAKAAR